MKKIRSGLFPGEHFVEEVIALSVHATPGFLSATATRKSSWRREI